MILKALLTNNRRLRSIIFPLFARFNPGDVTIKHHHTGDPLRLHSFRHRGYWWHGKAREAETMAAFRAIIRPGTTVFDVGTHIGYVSLYFAWLVGPSGRVHAFEPGENNLPYTRANLGPRANITLNEKALGPEPGVATMYLEDVTGQNNSIVENYEGVKSTSGASVTAHVRKVDIEMTTVDRYVESIGVAPSFVKIDVEGFEVGVLRGATELLAKHHPMMMVETAAEPAVEVLRLFDALGYRGYRPDGTPVRKRSELVENTFFLHPEHHADALLRLGWR